MGGPAGLVRIGDRGLRLVVCGTHTGIRVRGQHLDLLARPRSPDPHALATVAGTPLTLARTTGAGARVAQQVLGTVRTTLGRRHSRSSSATRRSMARTRSEASSSASSTLRGAIGARCSTAGRATPAGRRRGPERCGSRPAARTAASNDPSNGRLAALVEGQTPSRYRSTRHSWARQRASEGFQSAEHGGSPKRSFHSRIFSMIVSRVQRVTRRPPAVFADGCM